VNDLETIIRRIASEEFDRRLAQLPKPAAPDTLIGTAAVAAMLGCSRRALAERFRRALARGERHPLDALSFVSDGLKRWRRSDAEQFIANGSKST
jgi:hypothetical protein